MNLPSVYIFNWLFLLALFPVAFFWLRRAYRILIQRDFSEVALKKGVAPPNAGHYAPYEMAINLVGGIVIVVVIAVVLLGLLEYQSWIAVAGSTLWIKLFASFAPSAAARASWASANSRALFKATPTLAAMVESRYRTILVGEVRWAITGLGSS